MMQTALVSCADYEIEHVRAALSRAFALLGGLEAYIQPGMRVFLKANLLRRSDPARAAVTHPAVVQAVAEMVQALGAQAVIGDSPGGPYNPGILKGIYRATGMERAAQAAGAELNLDCRTVQVENPQNRVLREFNMLAPVREADAVINLAKLKTHTLATYSGAVKNLFGVIPGLEKAEMHFRFQELDVFTDMLLDVERTVAPVLNVIDAVVGMEGEGPGSGDPRKIGAILASSSAYAADVAATRLAGFALEEIPVLRAAKARGIEGLEPEIVGDALETLAVRDFVRANSADNGLLKGHVPAPLRAPLERLLALKPVVQPPACVGCGVCARVCPADAIQVAGGKAHIHKRKCIRCFCCMEFCPEKAVAGRRPWVFRAAIRLTGGK